MHLEAADVDAVCGLVLDLCGVYLDESKSYLIETRLSELVSRSGCANYRDFVNRVRRHSDLKLKREIVDAITTGETLFFRDSTPFDAFRNKVLPELFDRREANAGLGRGIRIWSAGSSTGQEAYSIAMAIHELIPDAARQNIQILGTDISDQAIAKASRGQYSKLEAGRGLTDVMLAKYFEPIGNQWKIKDEIRSMVSFRQWNLHDSFAALGKFDVVFCRNVAIYFTPESRRSVFTRLRERMPEYGYLFVGSAEVLTDLGESFRPLHHCGSVYYQPNLCGAPA